MSQRPVCGAADPAGVRLCAGQPRVFDGQRRPHGLSAFAVPRSLGLVVIGVVLLLAHRILRVATATPRPSALCSSWRRAPPVPSSASSSSRAHSSLSPRRPLCVPPASLQPQPRPLRPPLRPPPSSSNRSSKPPAAMACSPCQRQWPPRRARSRSMCPSWTRPGRASRPRSSDCPQCEASVTSLLVRSVCSRCGP